MTSIFSYKRMRERGGVEEWRSGGMEEWRSGGVTFFSDNLLIVKKWD
jgi:hypothetical protein